MKKPLDFIKKYPLLTAFTVFMLTVFVADMFATGKQYSELENRSLKQRPRFSWASLAANEYTRKYEEFINDQFVERDRWISLKSIGESVFFKVENNGIAYGADNYLFGVKTTVENDQLERNIEYLNGFLADYSGNVTLGIIPNSYELLPDYLPTGLGNIQVKQQPLIRQIYDSVQGQSLITLDIAPALEPAGYYRTDHHWSTDNAWRVYQLYCKSNGLQAVQSEQLAPLRREAEGFYGTYQNKAKKTGMPADTLVWYDIPATMTIDGKTTLQDDRGDTVTIEGMLRKDKLDTRDKYAMFLYGNNGLTVIKSENNLNHVEGKTSRLLLVKDSYANCMVPFLTYSYDELYVVDLRGLGEKFADLVNRVQPDDLWVLYNYESFEGDRNLMRMGF